MRLIDADVLLRQIKDASKNSGFYRPLYDGFEEIVNCCPTIEAEPVRTNTTITVKTELRVCIVNGQKALFHRWDQRSEIVEPSLMRGGHQCVVVQVVGIIELEDGTIHEAYPWKIRFLDGKVGEYFAKMDGGEPNA